MYNWSFYGVKEVVCYPFLNTHNFQIYKDDMLIFGVYYNQPVVIVNSIDFYYITLQICNKHQHN